MVDYCLPLTRPGPERCDPARVSVLPRSVTADLNPEPDLSPIVSVHVLICALAWLFLRRERGCDSHL